MTAKLLTNFYQINKLTFNKLLAFEKSQHFSPYLREKTASYKILKEIRAVIASVVGLV